MDESTNAQSNPWVQEQLKAHVGHLVKHGLMSGHVRSTIAWLLPDTICLSRVGSKDNANFAFWVVSGEHFSTDHIERKLAETPRLALRHFALKWQLRAARLGEKPDPGQEDMSAAAAELERHAQLMYALSDDERHWAN